MQAKYFRKGSRIRTPDGTKKFKSINAAKRESRALQLSADGALGRGSLRAVNRIQQQPRRTT